MGRFLAVAHQTAETVEFIDAVKQAAARDPAAEFVLLVPATPVDQLASWTEGEAGAIAAAKAASARRRLEQSGVNVIDAKVGDFRPLYAVLDELDNQAFDGVIVATFPPGISRWLAADLVHRLQRSTPVPVTHVIAH